MLREVLSLQDLARQGRDQRSYGDEEIESADQSFFLAPRGTRKLQLRQEAQNLVTSIRFIPGSVQNSNEK